MPIRLEFLFTPVIYDPVLHFRELGFQEIVIESWIFIGEFHAIIEVHIEKLTGEKHQDD